MQEDGYSLRDIRAKFGATRNLIERMVAAGLLRPWRAARGALRFSFRDVVLIRTAMSLRAARIPAGRVVQAMRKLAESRADSHLSSLRISAVGRHVAVREGSTDRLIDTGQLVIPFDSQDAGAVAPLPSPPYPYEAFARAEALESEDAGAAEHAYRRLIAMAPGHADAYLNLGVMLSGQGRHQEAMALYRQALAHLPDDPHLHYNLGVAQEDAGDIAGALASYHRCIALAPGDADAHFNAARLHQALGEGRMAIRYFSAYRRLRGE